MQKITRSMMLRMLRAMFVSLIAMALVAMLISTLPAIAQDSPQVQSNTPLSNAQQETSGEASFKIGHVSIKTLIDRAPQALAAKRRLDEEFAPRNEGLKQLKNDIDKLQDELEDKRADKASSVELAALNKRVRSEKRKLRRMESEFKEDLNIRRNEELVEVQRIVLQAILKIAEQQKYDLLVQQPLYASKRTDITPAVLEALQSLHEEQGTAVDN